MKKPIQLIIRNLFLITLGTFLLALGTAIFLIPSDLVTGGLSGIAIVLNKIYTIPTGNLPFTSIDIYVFILEWILFFLGLIVLGKSFSLKTLLSVIEYPFLLALCQKLVSPDVFNGFFIISGEGYTEILICALFGGFTIGAGVAITFIGGGSTGGLDILALVVCKYCKKVKSSLMVFVCDALVVLLGIFIIKDIIISLLGILSAVICALAVDKIFLGRNQAFIANIISEKYEEISEAIIKETERSTTIYDVTGGYTKKNRKVVMITYTMEEYEIINHIVSSIDPTAFMTISRAHAINGEGWTRPSEEVKDETSSDQKN